MDTKLNEIFYNPQTGLIGLNAFWKKAKEAIPSVKYETVKAFYEKQEINQRYKKGSPPVYYPVYAKNYTSYMCDLVFFDKYKPSNGISILLSIIGVNSKRGYIYPLKNKEKATINAAIESFIKTIKEENHLKPNETLNFITDEGTEFSDLKRYGEHEKTPRSAHRSLIVEPFNKNIRQRINKYIRVYGARYVDKLPELIQNYNNTYHSGIDMKPSEMTREKELEYILSQNRKTNDIKTFYMSVFPVGSHVRIIKAKDLFKKDRAQATKAAYEVVGWDGLRATIKNGNETINELPQNLILVDNEAQRPEIVITETKKEAVKTAKKERATNKDKIILATSEGFKAAAKNNKTEEKRIRKAPKRFE